MDNSGNSSRRTWDRYDRFGLTGIQNQRGSDIPIEEESPAHTANIGLTCFQVWGIFGAYTWGDINGKRVFRTRFGSTGCPARNFSYASNNFPREAGMWFRNYLSTDSMLLHRLESFLKPTRAD